MKDVFTGSGVSNAGQFPNQTRASLVSCSARWANDSPKKVSRDKFKAIRAGNIFFPVIERTGDCSRQRFNRKGLTRPNRSPRAETGSKSSRCGTALHYYMAQRTTGYVAGNK
jgi:hypothetical protein